MDTNQIKAINDAISFLAMVATEKGSSQDYETCRNNIMLNLEKAGIADEIYEHFWIITNQIKPYVIS